MKSRDVVNWEKGEVEEQLARESKLDYLLTLLGEVEAEMRQCPDCPSWYKWLQQSDELEAEISDLRKVIDGDV